MASRTPYLVSMAVIAGGILGSNQGAGEEPAAGLAASERKGPVFVERAIDLGGRVGYWLESSLQRVFPTNRAASLRTSRITARSESCSANSLPGPMARSETP